MPIPVTSLDDRTFDDLVAEARARLQRHLPESTQLVEGDPLYALTDLFAWMTESVIYRANLIPERQRQAFLNLLQIPMRPATPARGIVCIDAKPNGGVLPNLLRSEASLTAGQTAFTTRGELQAFPLAMAAMTKEAISTEELDSLGIPEDSLKTLYGANVKAFRPRNFQLGRDPVDLKTSRDGRLYLLIYMADKKLLPHANQLRENLAGRIINVGLAPQSDIPAERAEEISPRKLRWEIIWQRSGEDRKAAYLPLEVVADTSLGGRKMGVARLRFPRSTAVLSSQFATDPQYAGFANTPPEPPVGVDPEQVVCWLSLSAPGESDLSLGYLGMNAVEVVGQGVARDQLIGAGTGHSRQVFSLGRNDVEAASLELEVSEQGVYVPWQQVSHFAASHPDDRVYRFDAASGAVQFGDGLRGKRPQPGSRIRAAKYHYGGGAHTNQPPGAIKQLTSGDSSALTVRHAWPTSGGLDRESVQEAEQRIPVFLNHRNRAVTAEDFAQLALLNPSVSVGRAEVVPGLLPGSSLDAVRTDVPGVVSLFVMPPAEPAFADAPRPTAGMLRDVYTYIDERKLLGTELYVLSPQFVPLALSLAVRVLDPTRVTEITNAVNRTLLEYLWALAPGGPVGNGWALGRAVEPNELRAQAARVEGVLSVEALRLFYQPTEDGEWQETSRLQLREYELPEVMAVQTQEGQEQPPVPPVADSDSFDGDDTAVAVPVIPDVC